VVLIVAVFTLTRAADRYPHIGWLQEFRRLLPRLPEDQRRKARRRANVYAGAEMILLGVALPIGYFALSMMTFRVMPYER
jgi:hypothetical protein